MSLEREPGLLQRVFRRGNSADKPSSPEDLNSVEQTRQLLASFNELVPGPNQNGGFEFASATLSSRLKRTRRNPQEEITKGEIYSEFHQVIDFLQLDSDKRIDVKVDRNWGGRTDERLIEIKHGERAVAISFNKETAQISGIVTRVQGLAVEQPQKFADQLVLANFLKMMNGDLEQARDKWIEEVRQARQRFAQDVAGQHGPEALVLIDTQLDALRAEFGDSLVVFATFSSRSEEVVSVPDRPDVTLLVNQPITEQVAEKLAHCRVYDNHHFQYPYGDKKYADGVVHFRYGKDDASLRLKRPGLLTAVYNPYSTPKGPRIFIGSSIREGVDSFDDSINWYSGTKELDMDLRSLLVQRERGRYDMKFRGEERKYTVLELGNNQFHGSTVFEVDLYSSQNQPQQKTAISAL